MVRKDLTKLVKEGANVPVYVLEYLLGNYCASNDETVINEGLQTVKKVLAENYVRPDEAEKVKSTIRERGSLKIIDKVTVTNMPPPVKNGWQFWLATTPYGMQLWALLKRMAGAGLYIGGLPERRAFRKVFGTFGP